MVVYRISQTKYASALIAPGFAARWNSEGQKMIYTAGSIALACLENLAHRSGVSLNTGNFSIATIGFPNEIKIEEIGLNDLIELHTAWDKVANYNLTQQLGDQWLNNLSSAVLKVPSAIVPMEFNYLLNPYHPDFTQIKIEHISAFQFDPRLKLI